MHPLLTIFHSIIATLSGRRNRRIRSSQDTMVGALPRVVGTSSSHESTEAAAEVITATLEDRVAAAWGRPPPPPRSDFRFRRIDTVLASGGPGGDGGCDGNGNRLGPLVLDLDQLFAQVSIPPLPDVCPFKILSLELMLTHLSCQP
jgi:hypothetical protein